MQRAFLLLRRCDKKYDTQLSGRRFCSRVFASLAFDLSCKLDTRAKTHLPLRYGRDITRVLSTFDSKATNTQKKMLFSSPKKNFLNARADAVPVLKTFSMIFCP